MTGRVEIGDTIEDFTLPDETGTPRSLSGLLADGPVVLFFYPAALTPGCTAQACHFRDLAAEFAAVGARPVGISGDPVERQREFAGRHTLGMPLLSDADGTVRERPRCQAGLLPRPHQAHHLRHSRGPDSLGGRPQRTANERARRPRPRSTAQPPGATREVTGLPRLPQHA